MSQHSLNHKGPAAFLLHHKDATRMSSTKPIMRIATGLAAASVAFLAGFSVSSASSSPSRAPPIVNPHAWDGSVAPQHTRLTTEPVERPRRAAAKCNPWEVSEVAMEEILLQMQRRGWRPPSQGEAIASLDVANMSATDPYAPTPGAQSGNYITVLDDSAAERLIDDVEISLQAPPS